MTVLGTTSFRYTLTDSLGRTAEATVRVIIDDALGTPLPANDTAATNKNVGVVIPVKGNDSPATATVDRVSVTPVHGSAVLQPDQQILYTPTAGYVGTDQFKYMLKLGDAEAEGTVDITVNDTSVPGNRYVYIFRPTYSLPVDADVDIWNVPTTGGLVPQKGANNKALLIVAPDGGVTSTIEARDLLYGAVFLIGATLRPRGGASINAPSGTGFKGQDMLRIGFAAGIAVRPILFIANIDYDPRDADAGTPDRCWWGDFCRTGTNNNAANYAEWVNVYLQKIKAIPGNYGYTGPSNNQNPRSNFLYPQYGGLANCYASGVDVSWGYQIFMPRNGPTDECFPDGRLRLNKVRMEWLPANSAIYGGDGFSSTLQMVYDLKSGANAEQIAGQYYAADLTEVYAIRGSAPGSYLSDFEPRGTAGEPGWTPSVLSGNRLTFHNFKAASRALPCWTGFVDYQEPSTPMVNGAEIGHAEQGRYQSRAAVDFPIKRSPQEYGAPAGQDAVSLPGSNRQRGETRKSTSACASCAERCTCPRNIAISVCKPWMSSEGSAAAASSRLRNRSISNSINFFN